MTGTPPLFQMPHSHLTVLTLGSSIIIIVQITNEHMALEVAERVSLLFMSKCVHTGCKVNILLLHLLQNKDLSRVETVSRYVLVEISDFLSNNYILC